MLYACHRRRHLNKIFYISVATAAADVHHKLRRFYERWTTKATSIGVRNRPLWTVMGEGVAVGGARGEIFCFLFGF